MNQTQQKRCTNMETVAVMAIIPLLLMILYIALFAFGIWFCVSLIKAQREKNQVLKDISNKLDNLNYLKKEA